MNPNAPGFSCAPSSSDNPAAKSTRPPVSILIAAYGGAAALRKCLASLAAFAPRECFLYVLDDATSDSSIRKTCEETANLFPELRYLRSETNRGFVGLYNWGYEAVREPGSDVMLLNSDTEVTAGFLEEMQAVLNLHERHGVVSPRSNNGKTFSIPVSEAGFDAADSSEMWKQLRHLLPRYQLMPTAASFCILIKAEILDRFGLFDEAYAGVYAEDDFVCRINRYGYSAVAANWAYVFQYRSLLSDSGQIKLAESHRDLLLYRYPEYERKAVDYDRINRDPLERFAALYRPHRPRILYDLFHLTAVHTGTSDFGLNLLRELSRIVEGEFDLFVGMSQAERFFASELTGYRMYEDRPDSFQIFDLVFKPCQVLSWTDFRRMDRLAPRLSCTMLDIIGVRCDYLNSPERQMVLQRAAEMSDCVFTLSKFSRSDFASFYGEDIPFYVIPLGTNFGMTAGEFRPGEHVLVVGNSFTHKGVREAIHHLGAEWPVIVLGGEPDPGPANVRWLASGNLSRQHVRELFSNARVLVYPSYYEGFGLPVIDALALGKPVVVLDSAINRELAGKLGDSNFHRISSMKALHSLVAKLFETESAGPSKEPRRWTDVAADYVQVFRELLSRDFDLGKMRARWELLRNV
ncbi:MAG: glycosyltransferase [Acidobacteriaceae bacterium]|nr:glycosyltransferase [Acidobacteriaceae bacterium]